MGEVMNHAGLDRRAAVAELLRDRGELLVVSGLGSASYDLMAAGDDARNFYLWAAMGSACTVGLGLAMAQPERPVLVLTGDGEMLMGLGAIATAAQKMPANLSVVVLDNGHYGETGMQMSHTGRGVDLARIAAACDYPWTSTLSRMDEIGALRDRIHARAGSTFATVRIAADELPRALPPRDGVHLKNRFRAALGHATI